MYYGFKGYARPSFECKPCAAGRYGAQAGLTSSACSGLCAEGYYCPMGSASSTAFPCGGAHVYCPLGSPRPIPAAAGRFTINSNGNDNSSYSNSSASASALGSVASEEVRSAETLCAPGHYCALGVSRPCPLGRYGNSSGLRTPSCTAQCVSGQYCPAGSVQPAPCPLGHYCPDGAVPVICPAGTYGGAHGMHACSFVGFYTTNCDNLHYSSFWY
jgi:hypothetical protein